MPNRLRHMFGKVGDPTLLAQGTYKRYFDKTVRVKKRFNEVYTVFLDRPMYEPETSKERDQQIVKSKRLPK